MGDNRKRIGVDILQCPKGHPYTPENIRPTPRGSFVCRQCDRLDSAARRQAKGAPERRFGIRGANPRDRRTLPERFWENVPIGAPDECWEWTGRIMTSWGYGALGPLRAHRVSWEIANERPVPDGLFVLHSCDNPPCVNPAHLRTGTTQDNSRDIALRGRQRGERNGFHKLTQSEVDAIRGAHAKGVRNVEQARKYHVHPSTISLIVNRINWAA